MEQLLLTSEETKAVSRRSDVFSGYGDAGNERTIKWMRKSEMPDEPRYTNPTANFNGVSGWCTLDGVRLRRVHVCAHDPCKARHVDRRGGRCSIKVWHPWATGRSCANIPSSHGLSCSN